MRLIDTHCHLDFPKLAERREELFANASEAGVERMVAIGASRGLDSNYRALEIARAYPERVRCTAGIHPHDAEEATDEVIRTIREDFAQLPEVVGIGETGLDYFYDNAPKEKQQQVFRAFLRMSKEVDKPVVIHAREADEDTLRILREEEVTGGILHCFTGGRPMAEALVGELDFYIAFSGIVTFKSGAELLRIAAEVVPEERILVETDSPYLAPVPHRGRTNEPAYVRHTAEVIAAARGVDLEVFAEQTYQNGLRVYRWSDEGAASA